MSPKEPAAVLVPLPAALGVASRGLSASAPPVLLDGPPLEGGGSGGAAAAAARVQQHPAMSVLGFGANSPNGSLLARRAPARMASFLGASDGGAADELPSSTSNVLPSTVFAGASSSSSDDDDEDGGSFPAPSGSRVSALVTASSAVSLNSGRARSTGLAGLSLNGSAAAGAASAALTEVASASAAAGGGGWAAELPPRPGGASPPPHAGAGTPAHLSGSSIGAGAGGSARGGSPESAGGVRPVPAFCVDPLLSSLYAPARAAVINNAQRASAGTPAPGSSPPVAHHAHTSSEMLQRCLSGGGGGLSGGGRGRLAAAGAGPGAYDESSDSDSSAGEFDAYAPIGRFAVAQPS